MKCDFCSSSNPAWEYPAESFGTDATVDDTLTVPLLRSAGSWLACQKCSDLIESGDMNTLAKRSLNAYNDLSDTSYGDELLNMILVTHQAFLNRRTGPAERIQRISSFD